MGGSSQIGALLEPRQGVHPGISFCAFSCRSAGDLGVSQHGRALRWCFSLWFPLKQPRTNRKDAHPQECFVLVTLKNIPSTQICHGLAAALLRLSSSDSPRIDSFAARCKKMPKQLREWPAYNELKKEIEADLRELASEISMLGASRTEHCP